jgi:4-hydroxy-tetrahydrodipicolinate reductase
MKIALIGYGKMGKEIEKIALSRGHQIACTIDIDNVADLNNLSNKNVDVAIEFTAPHTAYDNVVKCLNAGIPIVSGSTGWNEKLEEARKLCNIKNGTFFWASNYSIGVNVFFKLNEILAKMMKGIENYEPSMTEIHHIHKKDAPSGTAITLAEGLMKNYSGKKSWKLSPDKGKDILTIEAQRTGEVPGTHIIKYDSPVDYLEITHCAKGRQGLALGAILAAEFIKDKKGVFGMGDLFKLAVV